MRKEWYQEDLVIEEVPDPDDWFEEVDEYISQRRALGDLRPEYVLEAEAAKIQCIHEENGWL